MATISEVARLLSVRADALKFGGPAPELVQGRLAMVGLLKGAVVEVQTGEPVVQQALHSALPVALLTLVLVYASMVPILKGARSEPFGAHLQAVLRLSIDLMRVHASRFEVMHSCWQAPSRRERRSQTGGRRC